MGSKAFSPKQLKILAFANSDRDALICDGSVRSGKTSVMSTAFVLWAMRDFNGHNFAICSKTVQTAVKNVVKPLLAMSYWKAHGYELTYRRNSGEIIIKHGRRQNTFYVYGGKDESSYMLIQGITLAGVLLDEVALMPRSFVEQALARCSVTGSKFWFNCNPEGQLHWFNQEWILQADSHNATRLHFTMQDNPSLSEDVIRRYESMYSGVFYDRYIKGLWVTADGLVYDQFSEERHVIQKDSLPETEGGWYVSSDYGIQNPNVWLLWRRVKDSNRWLCVRESYYSGRDEHRQKTDEELLTLLDDILKGAGENGKNAVPEQIIIDPSAASMIALLRRRGYNVRKAKNDVLDGIADMSTMLAQGRILYSSDCAHTIGEFGMYVWDEKAMARGEDAPVKQHDHGMDASRYFVKTMQLVRRADEAPFTALF